MGADIHIRLERKVNGQWHLYERLNGVPRRALETGGRHLYDYYYRIGRRNYSFFADIAGVRGPGPEPRGIPDDISPLALAEIEDWGADAHSHTWLYADELCEIFIKHHMTEEEVAEFAEMQLNGSVFKGWEYVMNFYIANIVDDEPAHNYRFIIFFDN